MTARNKLLSSTVESNELPEENDNITSTLKASSDGLEKTPTPETAPITVARKTLTVPASRLPHHVLIRVFQFISLKDVQNCMLVCKNWNNVLSIENSPVWHYFARRLVPEAAHSDPFLLKDISTYKRRLRAFFFSWNSEDISKNNYVRPNGFTLHRNPVAQSTDGVRGKIGISRGIHAFDMVWEGPLGTVAVIGVATKELENTEFHITLGCIIVVCDISPKVKNNTYRENQTRQDTGHAALHCQGYTPLLGSDDQSWGWNLVDNTLLHNGESLGTYPRVNNPPHYKIGQRVRLVLDCEKGLVYFEYNSEFLGIAFRNLPPVKLFPAVCAVYGNTEVSMIYQGSPALG